MGDHTPTRFNITWKAGRYLVSIPNYKGGDVVDADVADALVKALEAMLVDPPTSLNEPDTDAQVIRKLRDISRKALGKVPA